MNGVEQGRQSGESQDPSNPQPETILISDLVQIIRGSTGLLEKQKERLLRSILGPRNIPEIITHPPQPGIGPDLSRPQENINDEGFIGNLAGELGISDGEIEGLTTRERQGRITRRLASQQRAQETFFNDIAIELGIEGDVIEDMTEEQMRGLVIGRLREVTGSREGLLNNIRDKMGLTGEALEDITPEEEKRFLDEIGKLRDFVEDVEAALGVDVPGEIEDRMKAALDKLGKILSVDKEDVVIAVIEALLGIRLIELSRGEQLRIEHELADRYGVEVNFTAARLV